MHTKIKWITGHKDIKGNEEEKEEEEGKF